MSDSVASAMRTKLARRRQALREPFSFLKGKVLLALMWPLAAIVFSVLGWYSRDFRTLAGIGTAIDRALALRVSRGRIAQHFPSPESFLSFIYAA